MMHEFRHVVCIFALGFCGNFTDEGWKLVGVYKDVADFLTHVMYNFCWPVAGG